MISILLATYNGEKYIKQSIDSIVQQAFPYWELLIGLNGTTDNTRDILKEYDDRRIKIFDYGDDKGKAKTLNKLLHEANGEWLAIQDDDDIWHPDKLKIQIKYTSYNDVVGTCIYYINENNDITYQLNLVNSDSDIKQLSLSGNNQVANTSAIFKKSATLENNGWREDLDGIEDFDFWLRLMRKGKRFYNTPELLVYHRVHNSSNFNTKTYDIGSIL